MDRAPTLIDLFCGAGGMTRGFVDAGFVPMWANDTDAAAIATYEANFGTHAHLGDLQAVLDSTHVFPQVDCVVGGPPCQGFSLLNKGREGDVRRALWEAYMDVVERTRARLFVMENVPQLLGSEEHGSILARARRLGFATWSGKVNAADFGVPQRRERAIVIGVKGTTPGPPTPTHLRPNGGSGLPLGHPEWRTLRDAIGDLPPPVGTEIRDEPAPLDLHFGRNPTEKSLARYRAIPEEGMNRVDLLRNAPDITPDCWVRKKSGGTDLFGRLWWDRPAFTIRTEFFKPEKGRYLHPTQHRPITHREAARLQSFPDDFVFRGSKTQIARQIGNAVPVALAYRIAIHVRRYLESEVSEVALAA